MRILNRRSADQGIALIVALAALVVVAGIGLLLFTRTLNEMRHSRDDAAIVQTLMLARGGANIGSALLNVDVKTALHDIVVGTSIPGRWSYGRDQSQFSEEAPDATEVAKDLKPVASQLQHEIDSLVCGVPLMPEVSNASVRIYVYFTDTACGYALPSAVKLPPGRFVSGPPRGSGGGIGIQEYALPFVLVSEGSQGIYRRNIVTQGEYIFEVGQASFSHWAYFTNRESDDGTNIYFTDATMIDGPAHTNGNYSLYKDPWFGGSVTSAGCAHNGNFTAYQNNCIQNQSTRKPGATFYSQGFKTLKQMGTTPTKPVFGTNAPIFSASVDWGAQFVPLPDNSISQKNVALGIDRSDEGLHFDRDLQTLKLWAGDDNEKPPTLVGDKWIPAARYQYVQSTTVPDMESYTYCLNRNWRGDCTRSEQRLRPVEGSSITTTYRFDENGRLEEKDSAGNWLVRSKDFNGVVYVSGTVQRMHGPNPDRPATADGTKTAPAIASFAEMTLAGSGDIRITGDIRYEEPPCSSQPKRNNNRSVVSAVCRNLNQRNVLGIYVQGGDIIVGNKNSDASLNAPDDVHVHAVLMSGSNQIKVENHDQTGDRGAFNLLGGMIQENRGLFGTFSTSGSRTTRTGYDRVYTYDPRMRRGVTPPFFPTTGLGSVKNVRYFSFGQREQLF